MATLDQKLAESGRSDLLDRLRNTPGGYEKAVQLFNSGQSPELAAQAVISSGGSGDLNSMLERGKSAVEEELTNQIIELDRKFAELPFEITDAESEAFLQKAIEQTKPYYDKKIAEIEAGINEGKIRTAEDLLIQLRQSAQEAETTLKGLDIDQAQTEEEFVNQLANITATKAEDLEMNRLEWIKRIGDAQKGQVQSGTLTSGVGQGEVADLQKRQEIERQRVERIAGSQEKSLQTGQKYTIERIKLARQKAQQDRERFAGTGDQASALTETLKTQAGITGELPSEAQILTNRGQRNVDVYKPSALTDITEESKRAIESRKLRLQEETLAQRERENKAKEKIYQNEFTAKQNSLNAIRNLKF